MVWIIALTFIIFLSSGIAYWTIVLWPWIKQRSFRTPLSYWRQILLVLPLIFIIVAITKNDFTQLLAVFSPPLGLLLDAARLWQFVDFSWPLVLVATTAFLGTTTILRKLWPSTSIWQPSIAFFLGIAAFLIAAEVRTDRLQKQAVEKMGLDCVHYKTFLESWAIAGEEFQFDYHSAGRIGEDIYGWSFMTLDFYKVPPSVKGNLERPC